MPVFSPDLGGFCMPMGRVRTVGSNLSTRLPYDRGAFASGLSLGAGASWAAGETSCFGITRGSLAIFVVALGADVLLENLLLVVGLRSARHGYVVLIARCWQSRHVASANGRVEVLSMDRVTARSSIVPGCIERSVFWPRGDAVSRTILGRALWKFCPERSAPRRLWPGSPAAAGKQAHRGASSGYRRRSGARDVMSLSKPLRAINVRAESTRVTTPPPSGISIPWGRMPLFYFLFEMW